MRVGSLCIVDLEQLDKNIKSIIRRICGIPHYAPNAYIEGPASCGCLGLPSLIMWQHAHTIAKFICSVSDDVSPVRHIARQSFLRAIQRASIREAIDALQMAATKGGPTGAPFGVNQRAPLCTALKALNSIMEFRLIAPNDQIEIRVGFEGAEMHSYLLNIYSATSVCPFIVTFATLLSYRRGHVFRTLSSCRTASSIVKSGWGQPD